MIDQISIYLPGMHKPSNVKIKWPGMYWTGYIENEPVRLNQQHDKLKITVSLPKLLQGENMTVISRKQVQEAVLKLESVTGLELSNAVVRTIEIGITVNVKKTPGEYFYLCGDHSRLNRHLISKPGKFETVLYTTTTGKYSFQLYDKIAQGKSEKKQMSIPEIFQDQNVLRLEYKIKKQAGIKSKFDKDLFVHELYEPYIYKRLKNLFHAFYLAIPKTGRGVFINLEMPMTPKDFEKAWAFQYRQLYPDAVRQSVILAKSKGYLDRKGYHRLRAILKTDNLGGVRSLRNELIAELDSFVSNWVKTG